MAARREMEIIDSAYRAQLAFEEELSGDKMLVNMGPSHPSTHGVLRVIL